MGVPDAGAIQMQQQTVAVAEPAHGQDPLQGIDQAAAVVVRVLQCDHPGGRPVRIRIRVHVLLHSVGIERAVGRIEAAQLQAAEGRRAALLVVDDVGLRVQEELITAPCLRVQRRLVGLGAAGEIERRLLTEQCRRTLLEPDDGGVIAQHVVADLGLEHGLAHTGAGPGDGVAAQVDRSPCHPRPLPRPPVAGGLVPTCGRHRQGFKTVDRPSTINGRSLTLIVGSPTNWSQPSHPKAEAVPSGPLPEGHRRVPNPMATSSGDAPDGRLVDAGPSGPPLVSGPMVAYPHLPPEGHPRF